MCRARKPAVCVVWILALLKVAEAVKCYTCTTDTGLDIRTQLPENIDISVSSQHCALDFFAYSPSNEEATKPECAACGKIVKNNHVYRYCISNPAGEETETDFLGFTHSFPIFQESCATSGSDRQCICSNDTYVCNAATRPLGTTTYATNTLWTTLSLILGITLI